MPRNHTTPDRLQSIADVLKLPVSSFFEPLASQVARLTPALDVNAKEFGFLISEAFRDCNDIDGPHWPTVARKVAEAIGVTLAEDA